MGEVVTLINSEAPNLPIAKATARLDFQRTKTFDGEHLRNSPPSLLIIGNNYLKQLAFGARAHSPAPICRSSNYHDSECSRYARRIMLFLKVVMVVSKSQYLWVKNVEYNFLGNDTWLGGHVLEWCKTYGKGRIFYTALGDRAKDWCKKEWLLHLFEATKWAMGERPDNIEVKTTTASPL